MKNENTLEEQLARAIRQRRIVTLQYHGLVPSWRTYRVKEVSGLHVTEATFIPPPDYNPADPHFAQVLARA